MAAPALSRAKYAALFAAEAREQLARAARAAALLGAPPPAGGPAAVDETFRAVHTVKGMAAAMAYAASEAAAHAAEHALGRLRAAGGAAGAADAAEVVLLVDALEAAVERDAAAPADAGDVLVPAAGARVVDAPAAGPPVDGPPATELPAAPAAPAARAARAAAGAGSVAGPVTTGAAPYVRVEAARLDALLDLAGELAAARGRLAAAAAHVADPALARAVHEVGRIAQAVQAAVLEARLVPVAELFERLPRVVREAARAAGREVDFGAAGGDAAVDRGVLDALAEPLTHLLRNAVDHGVEPPDERVARGKPRAGRVRVAAARAPGGVTLTVEDDGRGVDRAAVRAAAGRWDGRASRDGEADRHHPADEPDDDELLALLARPGLSTAERVTRVSGRGVGVDAALARVRALGGSLALVTEAGRGTRFTLRVPLTLAVTPVLLVRAGGVPYALPLAHVRGTREPAGAGPTPVPLARLVGVASRADVPTGDVVLLDAPGGAALAAGVDRIDGQADCVVKPLPRLRGAFRTAAGATILDGGEVALVLDVPALLARLPATARP